MITENSDQDLDNKEEAEIPAEALDDGPEKENRRTKNKKTDPVRKCLLTSERKPKTELIRFVLGPDLSLVPDLKATLPGRGMWISATAAAIEKATKRGLFSKAAKGKVVIPDDLVALVEKLLVRRCVENMSLANRAGHVVTGFEKVRAALKSGRRSPGGMVLAAHDGADDGKRKVGQLAKALGVPISEALGSAEIGKAFGRDAVIHAYLLPGGLTGGLRVDTARLIGFRVENMTASLKEEG